MTSYSLKPGRAAIVTETFLPAKYVYSPECLSALNASLCPQKVQEHFFQDNKKNEIKSFLPPPLKEDFENLIDRIKESNRAFGGYSIYDIHGAWKNEKNDKAFVERDANACVRLFDWPTFSNDDDNQSIQQIIRTVFALRLHHERSGVPKWILCNAGLSSQQIEENVQELNDWIDEGSLVLYGFVMYKLAEVAERLAAGAGQKKEKAILLTSHFSVVNEYVEQQVASEGVGS